MLYKFSLLLKFNNTIPYFEAMDDKTNKEASDIDRFFRA